MKRMFLITMLLAMACAAAHAQSPPPLTIREADGSPRKTNASALIFPNGSLSASGGSVTVTFGSTGANAALSNLAAVAVNTDLLPASTQSLGNASFPWLQTFTGNTTQYEQVSQSAGLITHAALGSATNIGFRFTPKGSANFAYGTGFTLDQAGNLSLGGALTMTAGQAIIGVQNSSFIGGTGGGTQRIGTGFFNLLNSATNDAGTTTVTNPLILGHQSSGTPTAPFGTGIQLNANDSTTADVAQGQFYTAWDVATHASRRSWAGIQTISHAQTQIDRDLFGRTLQPTNNTVTTAATVSVASNSVAAVVLKYGVEVFDGTNLQVEEGMVSCHIINKAGALSNNVCTKFGNQQALGSGTLTVTWTITAASPALVQINANSSLTPSAGYPRINFDIFNGSSQAVVQ